MNPPPIWTSALLLITCLVVLFLFPALPSAENSGAVGPATAHARAASTDTAPFASFTHHWRDDPIWHDGKAEFCVYDATRTIYGTTRRYQARLYTNKEMANPNTKTKSADNKGRAVFKHHLREDIPTENYSYHYSTMCYVGTTDLKSLKIDMGSQEDCGTTLKQFVNHAGTCAWHQFSYFPNEGHRSGSYGPPKNIVFQDALSLVLRGFPFDNPPATLRLQMLSDQTSSRLTPSEPTPVLISYVGPETLDLPVGQVKAHHVRVAHVERPGSPSRQVHDYWFAAEGTAPRLHVMVQYKGPGGITYKLREQRRWAYWRR